MILYSIIEYSTSLARRKAMDRFSAKIGYDSDSMGIVLRKECDAPITIIIIFFLVEVYIFAPKVHSPINYFSTSDDVVAA